MSEIANMLRFYREGLQRVAKIIDANSGYDDLLEHRLTDSERMQFGPDTDILIKREKAIDLLKEKLCTRKHRIILPEFTGIACDGKTKNNLREFAFLDRICSGHGIKIAQNNYADCDTISVSKLDSAQSAALDAIVADATAYYHERSDISASLVRQQILYSRSFFNFLLSFSRPGAVRPVALVQANDHSPVRVALAMIMKALGVPRIYLQHAEVTHGFPELDFEFSVLRNRHSREIYEAIGPLKGKVFVIPRHEESFSRDRLIEKRREPITVVIYPTSRVLVLELRQVVEALERNPAVGRILIKQHPGAARRLNQTFQDSSVEFVEDFPVQDHVAIVGNSSVAIELLHRGIPVYQVFGFDPVDPDYYGFVKSGLTFEVEPRGLAERFWRPYHADETWLSTYARWNPAATTDYVKEQAEFVADMIHLAAQARRPERVRPMRGRLRARLKGEIKRSIIRMIKANQGLSARAANLVLTNSHRTASFLSVTSYRAADFLRAHTDIDVSAPIWTSSGRSQVFSGGSLTQSELIAFLEFTLCQLKRPADWLRRNEQDQVFPGLAVITALEAMFHNRRPELRTVFEAFTEWPAGSAVGSWAYLKRLEWGNMAVPPAELEEMSRFIHGYSADPTVKSLLERALFLALLRSGTCEQLDQFWLNAATVRKESLGFNSKIALLRRLRSTPGREAEADCTLKEFGRQATPFEQLKLMNMEHLEGRATTGWNHQSAEALFAQRAPRDIAQEFSAQVRPVYETLRPKMRFMDVRSTASEAEALLALIRGSIKNKRPFSLIRLSDGEGYLFPEGRYFDVADAANRERHWWGIELPSSLRAKIVQEARQTIASADVVGIPSVYRFIRDHGDTSRSLTQSVQGRGLLQVLQGAPGATGPQALITEDKVNLSLFSDIDSAVGLAKLAERVTIVGSVKAEHLPPALKDAQRTDVLLLPTHARTALNDKYNDGTGALPLSYVPLLEKLDALAAPGNLVLVAGGIIGKIFVGRARARGAVALDIGSVLDDWITPGIPTMR